MTEAEASFDDRFGVLVAVAYKVAFRLLGNRPEAEEVAQEALARALIRWPKISGHAEPWVARVATNLAIGRFRRSRPNVPFEERHASVIPGSDTASVERMHLVSALRRLPTRQRDAVALRYLADLPQREVAAAMRTSVGSVKQHTSRALKRLRLDLAPLPPEPDDA